MIVYDGPEALRKKILKLAENLRGIDGEDTRIVIYPDYIQKRKNCVASGITICSERFFYPCAIPDIGCSFRLVRYDGLKKEDIAENEALLEELTQFLRGQAKENLIGSTSLMEEMLYNGHTATAHLFSERGKEIYEEGGSYPIENGHRFPAAVLVKTEELSVFNGYQGHFLELLAPSEEEKNSVYLLIHSGSFILADRFRAYYYPLLARLSYQNGWSDAEAVTSGQFKISREAEAAAAYYNDVNGLLNFSAAYRDLAEYQVERLLRKHCKKEFEATALSDYCHTKLSQTGEGILHQRGIQYLKQSEKNEYVISGNYGVASMVFRCEKDGFFSHGVQTQTALCPESVLGAGELIAKEIKDAGKEQNKQAGLARLCYDFYQKKEIRPVTYLFPFYCFKENAT